MSKKIISTDNAPAAIGTYSQAVQTGNLVFISGQIPLDPKTGDMPDDFAEQAHQVFKNLSAVCDAAGGSLDGLVKVNVFVTDLGKFTTLNEVMGSYFTEPYPARAAVEVSALPKGCQVEIEGVLQL